MSAGQGPAGAGKPRSMTRGVLSFGGMTLLSRVFGLVRDQVFNTTFGANWMTDAFWVAFRIPNFMRRLFAEGSFSTAFVPVFTEIKETRTHADLKALMARAAGTLGGVLLVVTALGMLFAPQLATGFTQAAPAPGQAALITDLLRLTFPFLLCVSLTALAAGVERMPSRPTSTRPKPAAEAMRKIVWMATSLKNRPSPPRTRVCPSFPSRLSNMD